MNNIRAVQGEFYVEWYSHYTDFCQARDWCISQFGDQWGSINAGKLDRLSKGVNIFVFKRLYHAQWFVLRWL